MNAIIAKQVVASLFISILIGLFTKSVNAGLIAAGFLAVVIIVLQDAKDAAEYRAAQNADRF